MYSFGNARILAVVMTLSFVASAAAAQSINIGDLAECRRCELNLVAVVRLGEPEGPGIIESEEMQVSTDGSHYAVFHNGSTVVQLFDGKGTFLRRIGKRGEGPGEIGHLIDAQFAGGVLVTLDYRGARLSRFKLSGTYVGQARLPISPGPMLTASDTTVIVGTAAGSSVLHVVHIASGDLVRVFGPSVAGRQDPFAPFVRLGPAPSASSVWYTNGSDFRGEHWSTSGRRLTSFSGKPAWYVDQARGGPPSSIVLSMGTDDQRLWVITRIADEQWRDVQKQGAEGLVMPNQMADYFDTRVDIYDLRTREHIGSQRWDQHYAGLVMSGRNLSLHIVEYSSAMVPQVVIYRLEP